MNFSCSDFLSVSRMKRIDKNLMIWGCFRYKYPQLEIMLGRPFEKTDFHQSSVGSLVHLPVVWVQTHTWLCISISPPRSIVWTNPLGVWSIGKRLKEIYLPLIWPLTVFWIFKNSNFKNSWIWWSRQGVDEFSRFEACKRSGMMRRCAQMSWTWSGLI